MFALVTFVCSAAVSNKLLAQILCDNGPIFVPGTPPPNGFVTDGKHIFFDNPFPSEGGGIFQTTSDFSNSKILFGLSPLGRIGRDSDLSPDESQFVFLKAGPEESIGEIYKIDTLGKTEVRLTQNARYDRSPTWSPDGSRIAWSSAIRLSIMNADGSDPQEIGCGNTPSWSINNEIVFSHANADYNKEVLYTITPDGSKRKQITF
jgi:Tol biopolymer transport system component